MHTNAQKYSETQTHTSTQDVEDGEKQEAHHVKLLLEFLVRVVDTELLKTVNLKGFKPEENKRIEINHE